MLCNPAARVQGAGPSTGDGDPIDVNVLSAPAGGSVVVTDIEDGAGDSIMNAALNAARVEVVNTVTIAEPVSVDDNGGSLTVDGTVAVSNFPAVQPVNDNGGSLTVDDGGGSLTVDGTVTANQGTTPWVVTSNDTPGGANSGKVFPIAGMDGGLNNQPWRVESNQAGRVYLQGSNRDGSATRAMSASFRILGNAAAIQNLLTLEVSVGSGTSAMVTRCYVAHTTTAVLTAVDNLVQIGRTTALPTGGTVMAKVDGRTSLPSDANVIVRGANAADGGAATAITATIVKAFSRLFCGRLHTAVGQTAPGLQLYLLDRADASTKGLEVLAGEGIVVQVINPTAANNAATNHYVVCIEWEEYVPI